MALTANEAIAKLDEFAHRQSAEADAQKILESARTRLVISTDARSVFFATALMRLNTSPKWEIETAETNGRDLRYNPDFLIGLNEQERIGILAHEVMHCCNKHFARRGERDPEQWNIACDLAINPILIEAGYSLPAGGCIPGQKPFEHLQPGESAEHYYNELQKDGQKKQAGQPTAGAGSGGDDGDQNGQTDKQTPDPGRCGAVKDATKPDGSAGEIADQKQLDNEWTANVAAAQQAAQRRGQLPAGIERLCQATLAPSQDWKAELREFITRPAKNSYNWKRPNRRHIHRGIYLPSMHSLEIGNIVAAVDTSGSITDSTLTRFASELQDIAQQGVTKITILYHDSEIARVQEWTPEDGDLALSPAGGGGTDHHPVFTWIEENGQDEPPALLICLTDLASDFPASPPDYPVLWASTCERAPHPWGERLNIPEI